MDEELRASQSPHLLFQSMLPRCRVVRCPRLLLPGKLGESFAKPANVLCRVFALRSLPTRCHAAEPIWHFCTGRLFFKEALITQWCQAPAHNKLHPEGRPLNKQMCTCERASKQTTCNIMVPENRNDHEGEKRLVRNNFEYSFAGPWMALERDDVAFRSQPHLAFRCRCKVKKRADVT
jgi:hypothetical protein